MPSLVCAKREAPLPSSPEPHVHVRAQGEAYRWNEFRSSVHFLELWDRILPSTNVLESSVWPKACVPCYSGDGRTRMASLDVGSGPLVWFS